MFIYDNLYDNNTLIIGILDLLCVTRLDKRKGRPRFEPSTLGMAGFSQTNKLTTTPCPTLRLIFVSFIFFSR